MFEKHVPTRQGVYLVGNGSVVCVAKKKKIDGSIMLQSSVASAAGRRLLFFNAPFEIETSKLLKTLTKKARKMCLQDYLLSGNTGGKLYYL